MKYFTFIMNAAVTVTANSEKEAREIIQADTHDMDEDFLVGRLGVYLPPNQKEKVELSEIYDSESHVSEYP